MRALVCVAALLVAASARADTPAEANAIMRDYLDGEKAGGYVLVGMGAAGVTTGTFFLRSHCDVRKGMAYPLLVGGALHLAAGVYIGIASDRRIDKFSAEIERDGQAWVERERDRMDGVATQFTVLTIIELGLIAGGATMAYLGWRNRRGKLQGAGIGIAIEATATLVFDLWSANRASSYRDKLDGLDLTSPRISHTFTF